MDFLGGLGHSAEKSFEKPARNSIAGTQSGSGKMPQWEVVQLQPQINLQENLSKFLVP
jgi:hypothetical protein